MIRQYDEAIQSYENKLRENRAEPFFSFKYYQWFSLLFTEYFFDFYSNHKDYLVKQLNHLKASDGDFAKVDPFTGDDLKKTGLLDGYRERENSDHALQLLASHQVL